MKLKLYPKEKDLYEKLVSLKLSSDFFYGQLVTSQIEEYALLVINYKFGQPVEALIFNNKVLIDGFVGITYDEYKFDGKSFTDHLKELGSIEWQNNLHGVTNRLPSLNSLETILAHLEYIDYQMARCLSQ